MPIDIIATVVLIAILGGALFYVIRAKKNGAKCIGCAHSKTCGSKKDCGCGCGSQNAKTEEK